MLTLLAIGFVAWLVFGYFAYGRWITKQFQLDDSRTTMRIGPMGDVMPSRALPLVAGNVRRQRLEGIWSVSGLYPRLRDRERLVGRCSECALAKMLSANLGRILPPFTSPNFRLFFHAVSFRDCMGAFAEGVKLDIMLDKTRPCSQRCLQSGICRQLFLASVEGEELAGAEMDGGGDVQDIEGAVT